MLGLRAKELGKGRSMGNRKLLHGSQWKKCLQQVSRKERGRTYESKNSAAHPGKTGKSTASGRKWNDFTSAGQAATASLVCMQRTVQQRKGEGRSRQAVLCREASAHFWGDTVYTQGHAQLQVLPNLTRECSLSGF